MAEDTRTSLHDDQYGGERPDEMAALAEDLQSGESAADAMERITGGELPADVPEWVPEKFRGSPEKFGEAYVNLEREFHQRSQRLAELEQYVAAQGEQDPVAQLDAEAEEWFAAADEQDARAILAMQAGAASQATREQIYANYMQAQEQEGAVALAGKITEDLIAQFPDWPQYAERASAHVAALGDDVALADPARLTAQLAGAYYAVKTADADATVQSQRESEQAKLRAQTLTGQPGRPSVGNEDSDYWQSVKSMPSGRYGG